MGQTVKLYVSLIGTYKSYAQQISHCETIRTCDVGLIDGLLMPPKLVILGVSVAELGG